MNQIGRYTLIGLFTIFIFSFGFISIFSEDKESSYWENRTLTQRPALSTDSILDGSFTSKFETYFTDQFPLRDQFVYSYIKYQQLTNQTFVQNHYIDKDHFVYPKPLDTVPYDAVDMAATNTNKLAAFTQSVGSEFIYFYMPNRVVVLHENYPSFLKGETRVEAKDYLLANLDNNFKKFDLNEYYMSTFSSEDLKKLYYQTDHHWNAEGSLVGYSYIKDKLASIFPELQFTESEYIEHESNPNLEFLGSYNRQIYNILSDHQDKTNYYDSSTMDYNELKLFINEKTTPLEDIYHTEVLNNISPVTYAGIFSTDYRQMDLVYPKALNDKKVLIIKDSYTNAISLLLAEQFTHTTLYDVRHNQDRSLYDFIENGQYDLVLFLNSDVSFTGNNFYFEGGYTN